MEVPEEDKNIVKYNHREKYMNVLFAIQADTKVDTKIQKQIHDIIRQKNLQQLQ